MSNTYEVNDVFVEQHLPAPFHYSSLVRQMLYKSVLDTTSTALGVYC